MSQQTLTAALLEGQDLAGRALRAAQRSLPAALFDEVGAYVGHLRVTRNLSIATCHQYTRALQHFLLTVRPRGELPATPEDLRAVTPALVEGWLREQYLAAGAGARYRSARLCAVKSFFGWRVATNRQPSNPAAPVRGPKVGYRAARKYSTQQLRALFATCDRTSEIGVRDYAVLAFLYSTGARRGEMERLSVEDLELGPRVGRVRFHGKGAKERLVPFEGPPLDALREWFAVRDRLPLSDPSAVWCAVTAYRGDRLQMRGIEAVLERASERAGLTQRMGCGLHRLRVTFATDLYDSGVDIERIRILLGHESIETTRRYLAVSEQQLRTRLPAARAREVMQGRAQIPLWYQHKLDDEGGIDGATA